MRGSSRQDVICGEFLRREPSRRSSVAAQSGGGPKLQDRSVSEARQSSRDRCSNHTDEPPTISMTGNGNSSDESNARGDRAPERSRTRTRRVVSDEGNQKSQRLHGIVHRVRQGWNDGARFHVAISRCQECAHSDRCQHATLVANVIVDAHQGPPTSRSVPVVASRRHTATAQFAARSRTRLASSRDH
jgi:hypothetical protein